MTQNNDDVKQTANSLLAAASKFKGTDIATIDTVAKEALPYWMALAESALASVPAPADSGDLLWLETCLEEYPGEKSGAVRCALDYIRKALASKPTAQVQEVSAELVEKAARAMMRTVFDEIDVDKASLDWTGSDVWGCDFYEMAKAVLSVIQPPAAEWQDISTAPKDGTWIRLRGGNIEYGWCDEGRPPEVVGQWSTWTNCWQFAWYDSGYYGEYENPTHWQPITNEAGHE